MSEAVATRSDRLADAIAEAIIAGEFAPGAKLDEHGLAGRFGVSRTPVREALRLLGTTGLVELRPRRGAAVAEVTPAALEALFGAMAEMEATCARLCALGMSPAERRRLAALHERMGDLAAANERDPYAEANTALHGAIYAGAHNAVLAEIALGLRRRLLPYRRAQFRNPGRLGLSHAEHATVVAAILKGDAAAAHAAMLHHVELVEDAVELLASATRSRPPA